MERSFESTAEKSHILNCNRKYWTRSLCIVIKLFALHHDSSRTGDT
jgi:hypothetical protein